jgi:hypothetical protein
LEKATHTEGVSDMVKFIKANDGVPGIFGCKFTISLGAPGAPGQLADSDSVLVQVPE